MTFQKIISKTLVRGLRFARRLPLIGNAIVKAGFDAVRQTWGDRSWLFQSLQDAWLEIDALSRMELQRIHESLIENSCIVQKIRNLYLQFSVGPSGLICTPNASTMDSAPGAKKAAEKTAVENWNHARSYSWERWFRSPELNSDISGAQLTRVWSGLLFDKGEIFIHLTQEDIADARGVVRSRTPKVQTIDAHRCQTPDNMREHQGNAIIDGIEITPAGKVVAYWFKKTNFDALLTGGIAIGPECYDRIDAFDKTGRRKIVHKFKCRRPGQRRGVPEGFSVFNLVRDNMDLHKLEMQAAKLASELGNVETNASGELDPSMIRRARTGIMTQGVNGQSTTSQEWADYKVSIGGKNIALKSGDNLSQFMITRPTVATQDYWDLHYTMICIGYNVPKMLVMPYSLQGTVTRADLDICSYGFGREHYEIIAELLREVYEWQTEWAVNFDRSLDGTAPEDYLAVVIRPPRSPNVDIGYTAKSVETEVRLGIRTIPDIFAEKQQDWRQKTCEIAEYLKFVKEKAEEFGVDPSQITSSAINENAPAEPVTEKESKTEKEEPVTA